MLGLPWVELVNKLHSNEACLERGIGQDFDPHRGIDYFVARKMHAIS
jgi:hypothetical protein